MYHKFVETTALAGVSDVSSQGLQKGLLNNTEPKGASFADMVSREVMVINEQINTSEFNLRELAAGRADNLHQVMVSLNKAKLSFEMMVEVRNKLLEGYQEIMRMQV